MVGSETGRAEMGDCDAVGYGLEVSFQEMKWVSDISSGDDAL